MIFRGNTGIAMIVDLNARRVNGNTSEHINEIAHVYLGMRVGLPRIGAGLAGGDWSRIEPIIKGSLEGLCDVTIVTLP